MYNIETIKPFLPLSYRVAGNEGAEFSSVDSLFDAKAGSLTWVRGTLQGADQLVKDCLSSVIICDESLRLNPGLLSQKAFIITENPAIAFLRVVKCLYGKNYRSEPGIHPTAIVSAQARIGEGVSIGAYSIIGNCEIGDYTRVESFARINDHVWIGKNVLISEYCNIGGQGFGHIKNEHGELENMLHIGKVIIEDNVEIFPYTNVDRATLSATTIRKNAKIDHYCHIGHNTTVGENTVITAKVVLCGGATIGDSSWIGVGSIVRDSLKVGNNVVLGMGSCVTKPIPDNSVYAGSPAIPIADLAERNRKIKEL